MSDEQQSKTDDPDDRPIEIIRDLRREPKAGFLLRLRRKIDRRVVAGDIADAFLMTPILLLIHFLELLYGVFDQKKEKGESA